ncbi:hypothetical protein ABG768_012479 [Culter alburnus]|uniref:Uncharacterized protein n=1 Tax=Culter alburnus TaxID=194366 RepID=A0AAW2AZN8_CULAL
MYANLISRISPEEHGTYKEAHYGDGEGWRRPRHRSLRHTVLKLSRPVQKPEKRSAGGNAQRDNPRVSQPLPLVFQIYSLPLGQSLDNRGAQKS